MSDPNLPPLASEYLRRAAAAPMALRGQVRLRQVGEMILKPGARSISFTATERLAIDRTAFAWEARFRVAGVPAVRVTDGFHGGRGVLKVRVLGLPLQSRSGHEVSIGQVYRYLAELPWIPQAMVANAALRWDQVGHRAVEVSTEVGREHPTVTLEFDDVGDIVRGSAPRRPRQVQGGQYVESAWGGDFSAYETLSGIRLPTRAEVYWELPEGRFVYWRGRITAVEAVDQALEQ